MVLSIRDASCGYRDYSVLRGISLEVRSGEILCMLGPNGTGKTTLLKTVMGFLRLQAGAIEMDGEDICGWPQKKRAQMIGYVPQAHTPSFPFSVSDVVLMGRNAHLTRFATPTAADEAIVAETLELLGIPHLADRVFTELSGGERQMVLIARALAQEPRLLVLDEPTSNLDFGNQAKVLGILTSLAASGLGVAMTTHAPDHAFQCATKVILLFRDRSVITGTVDEVITEPNLREAYGVRVRILRDAENINIRGCVPIGE